MTTTRVEFTVEPFEVGGLGAHVVAAVDAARVHGAPVEVGPFASTVELPTGSVAQLVHDVVAAALANGATRLALQVETVAP